MTNYVFHYPFEATPVFLWHLAKPASPQSLSLDVGKRAHNAVSGKATVRELGQCCRNPARC